MSETSSVQENGKVPSLTADVQSKTDATFESLGLKTKVIMAVHKACQWDKPSPIQQEVIPSILEGRNVVARAKTGTGKTGSFMLPILNRIDLKDRKTIEALVIVPTRELSMQTSYLFINMSKHLPFEIEENDQKDSVAKYPKTLLLSGGTKFENHATVLRDHENQGIKIIVGTCGRIVELITKKALPLDHIKMVVLDEADKLLSKDMLSNVEKIITSCPAACQKILLSATYHEQTSEIIGSLVSDPKMVNIMDNFTLKGITTYYCYIEEKMKVLALNTLFNRLTINQAMIFVNSTKRAEALCGQMKKTGYSCTYIHSKMPQATRNQIFNDFKTNSHRIIICTDIFERGIDHPRVNVVINFDIPLSGHHYVHRAGRAGRYGRKGITIDMVSKDKDHYVKIATELGLEPQAVPEEFDSSLYMNY